MAVPLAWLLRLSSWVIGRRQWGSIFLACSYPSDSLWIDAVRFPVLQCHCTCGALFKAALTVLAAFSELTVLTVLVALGGLTPILSGSGCGFAIGGAGIFGDGASETVFGCDA